MFSKDFKDVHGFIMEAMKQVKQQTTEPKKHHQLDKPIENLQRQRDFLFLHVKHFSNKISQLKANRDQDFAMRAQKLANAKAKRKKKSKK